ncbi:multiple sugar transport system permease protein [Paenibacillus endophyticus]|uniref:Multiple sugar transport system permease protein n=1 Tax=Paenibacillus endophyticus TaxID=1294268 RepID=A0A7W5GD50_9BACL|nr:sugar ABC transporter permease [Paenibacillus endophyticus]MBB3154677.1 multiple sugar transport system permease protein [Paenibacillus endophyticus]
MKKRNKNGLLKMERRWGMLLALPVTLGLILFAIGPIIASFFFSLTDWQIGGQSSFIGLKNYETILTKDPVFTKSLFVTVYYVLATVPVAIIAAFGLAMLLNRKVKGLSIFRTIFFLPSIVPRIASTMLWLWLFNPDFGLLNSMLEFVGLPGSQWIYAEETAIPSIALMSVWGVGNYMIIFLAGLQSVPAHLYEAVEVDGGGAWRKFYHVTLPSMTPTIFFNMVMMQIGAFQSFDSVYVMTQGGPNNATLLYVVYLYRVAFTETKIGYASALSWILFIIIVVLTLITFRTSRKWVYYEGGGK